MADHDDLLEATPEYCVECLSPFHNPAFSVEEVAEADKDLCGGCRAIRKAVKPDRWKKFMLTAANRICNDWSKDNDVLGIWKSGYEPLD